MVTKVRMSKSRGSKRQPKPSKLNPVKDSSALAFRSQDVMRGSTSNGWPAASTASSADKRLAKNSGCHCRSLKVLSSLSSNVSARSLTLLDEFLSCRLETKFRARISRRLVRAAASSPYKRSRICFNIR